MDSVSVQPNGVASFEGSASKIEQGNGIIQTGGVFTMRDYNINQNRENFILHQLTDSS